MPYTKQNTRVERFQGDPTYVAGSTTATACPMTAFLQTKLLVNDADASDVVGGAVKPVSFDLLVAPVSTTNYTAAGRTVTGVQLAALIREVALQEATRQAIA